ncbi:MAG TPA: DUF952 domain-containing protein [Anaerolineaceae bacterium]|nr:DUF952 domain-containing protein [Anaerolineaceae bacterium]
MIYHITPRAAWENSQQRGQYQGETLASEGFIHCSTREQVLRTANTYFHGKPGLVLLAIDPARVEPEIRYEALSGAEQFPHIYGPLNLDAVEQVYAFEPETDGTFNFPETPL